MRRLAALLAGALLVVALGLAPSRESRQPATSARALTGGRDRPAQREPARPRRGDRSTAVRPRRRRARPWTSSSRTRFPPRRRRREGWAEFFAHLVHGPELAQLTGVHRDVRRGAGDLRLARPRLLCARPAGRPGRGGLDTSARRGRQARVRPPRRGHRLNDPWEAIDWGPKRWASAANVCARVDAAGGVSRRRGLELHA